MGSDIEKNVVSWFKGNKKKTGKRGKRYKSFIPERDELLILLSLTFHLISRNDPFTGEENMSGRTKLNRENGITTNEITAVC